MYRTQSDVVEDKYVKYYTNQQLTNGSKTDERLQSDGSADRSSYTRVFTIWLQKPNYHH